MGKQCIEAKAVVCIIVCKYETSFKMGVYGDRLLSGGNLKWKNYMLLQLLHW